MASAAAVGVVVTAADKGDDSTLASHLVHKVDSPRTVVIKEQRLAEFAQVCEQQQQHTWYCIVDSFALALLACDSMGSCMMTCGLM